ncbi:hypothetical protein MTO96_032761, partial [Rhipicephalus appendiculatus]
TNPYAWTVVPAACAFFLTLAVAVVAVVALVSAASHEENTVDLGGSEVPLKPGSLLCSIGVGFEKSTYTFPPDGLCTIIIFDSLYRKGVSLVPPYPEDFQYFLETAQQAQQSEFGIGFHKSIVANETAVTQLVSDPSTKTYLDELWDNYGVYHYAHVPEDNQFKGYIDVYVAAIAKALEMISALMNDRKNPKLRPSYTIVYFWGAFTTFCQISGEQTYDFAFNSLPAYSDKWPSKTQRVVSVGLHGLWYTPCAAGPTVGNRPANYSLGHRCGVACKKNQVTRENQTASIIKACVQPTYNRSFYLDTTFEALVAFDVKQGIIFTYDSAYNLRS